MTPSKAMRAAWAALVFFGLSGAVARPGLSHLGISKIPDDFPFSTYPMFSSPRPKLETATYVIGIDAEGGRHTVPYTLWASGGWNQGRAQIHRYKNGKAGGFPALCELVSGKLAKATKGWQTGIVEVRIVKGWYDRDRYFREDDRLPTKEEIYLSCAVPGRGR